VRRTHCTLYSSTDDLAAKPQEKLDQFHHSRGDNDFPSENLVLLQRPLVAEPEQDGTAAHNPEQAMRNPQPFVVIQNAKPLFTVYAYSLVQARELVAAKVPGETIVLPVSSGASR
jgi:hypothetical protein